jgi:L-amino acid N-acyltransferase YncA
MRDADLAIGAAGSTSWERCCLGLPAILFVMAENQRLAAENLERAGAVAVAPKWEDILPLLQQLLSDDERRLSMLAAAAAITDGHGTQLIADALTGRALTDAQLRLRRAAPEDSRTVWLWRNDYRTRSSSQTKEPIPWLDHARWWREAFQSADRHLMIAELAGQPVAFVRFDRVGESDFEVSINLAPSARGSGLGAQTLADACGAFRKEHGPVKLLATIHRDNAASRNIFGKLGFTRAGALSNSGFERYELAEGTVE